MNDRPDLTQEQQRARQARTRRVSIAQIRELLHGRHAVFRTRRAGGPAAATFSHWSDEEPPDDMKEVAEQQRRYLEERLSALQEEEAAHGDGVTKS